MTFASSKGHDDRANATPVQIGVPVTDARNIGATEEPAEKLVCAGSGYGKTVWHRVTVPANGMLTVQAVDRSHDSVIAVYPSGSNTPLACNDDAAATGPASVDVTVGPGVYDIQTGGYTENGPLNAYHGTFNLITNFTQDLDLDDDDSNGPPGPDCNDHDPAINPSAAEILNNAVDENCDGIAAMDADGDGRVAASTRGDDCNDGSPAIRPGAVDIPGNGVDEDCVGGDAKLVPARGIPEVKYGSLKRPLRLRIIKISVETPDVGTVVKVRCSGKGCPRTRTVTKSVTKATKSLTINMGFTKRLGRNATLTVTVSRQNEISRVRTITVGKSKVSDKRQCLWPGQTKPKGCI